MDRLCISDWETDLFPRFFSAPGFRPKTRMTFRSALRCFTAWCTDNGVDVPGADDVSRWRAFLLSRYRLATAGTYLSAVKVFFQWLSRQGLCEDIAVSVKGIQRGRGVRKDCLSDTEMKRLLSSLEKKTEESISSAMRTRESCTHALRDFVIVLLIAACGLRVSEVSLLDVGDLDMMDGEPMLWVHGKGRDGKSDFVLVTYALRRLLLRYLSCRDGVVASSPMFASYSHNSSGRRLSSRSISRIVKSALVDAGFDSPRLTAHSLRHTAVTLALKGGATLQQVQQFARHLQIGTTLHYAHNLEHAHNPCTKLVLKMIGRLDYEGLPFA